MLLAFLIVFSCAAVFEFVSTLMSFFKEEAPTFLLVLTIIAILAVGGMWFYVGFNTNDCDKEYPLLQQEAKEVTYAIENEILPEKEIKSKYNNFIVKYCSFAEKKMMSFHENEYETIEVPSLYWKCDCGKENEGYFCTKCGIAKPKLWSCNDCTKETREKYCSSCGQTRP